MKYRTDFVTNSSSSSYFCECWITYKDSSTQTIYGLEEHSKVKEIYSKLYNPYSYDDIKTFDELLPQLLFTEIYSGLGFDEDDINNSLFPVMVAAFLFLAGKKSFSETIDHINNFISEESPEWSDNADIRELLVIDPDNYDVSGLIEAVYEKLNAIFETDGKLNADSAEWYLNLSKENRSLSDVISLSFSEYESNYGEFVNREREYLEEQFGEDELRETSKEDPLYEKERNKWEYLLYFIQIDELYSNGWENVSVEDFDLDIDEGLQTGDFGSMVGSVILKRTEVWHFEYGAQTPVSSDDDRSINEKGSEDVPKEEFFTSMSTHAENDMIIEKQNTEEDNKCDNGLDDEQHAFFELYDCINNDDYSPQELVDSLKAFTEVVPKHFSKYPITDLFEKMIRYIWIKFPYTIAYEDVVQSVCDESLDILFSRYETEKNEEIEEQFDYSGFKAYIKSLYECLTTLIGIGFELDYADIAHYIYNDTLETIYPFFDRGLKIDPSAYDDLITYASEHGKPEYTAWLLDRKNKSAQGPHSFE